MLDKSTFFKKKTESDLFSTGIEEVLQFDDVAVFQTPHNLQLAILLETKKKTSLQYNHTNNSFSCNLL